MVLCAPIMKTTRSAKLFADAQQLIPGGVNSPVRAFRSVGGQPRFIKRAKGARLYDVDGNSYLDYVLSWGPMILGHAAPAVIRAIKKAAANGTSYGAPTELEVVLARMIRDTFPSMEKVRLVSSGTEAVMQAVRLARYHTRRSHLVRFCGAYHGWWGDVQPGVGNPVPARETYTLRDMSDDALRVLDPRVPFTAHSTAGEAVDLRAAGQVRPGAGFRPADPDLAGAASFGLRRCVACGSAALEAAPPVATTAYEGGSYAPTRRAARLVAQGAAFDVELFDERIAQLGGGRFGFGVVVDVRVIAFVLTHGNSPRSRCVTLRAARRSSC